MNGQRDGGDRPGDEPGETRLHGLDAIRSWPAESRQAASWVIHVHHEPDHVSETELVWDDVGPWARVVATREFEQRQWPVPHTASIRSEVRYRVPPDAVEAIERSELEVVVDEGAGLVATVGPDLRTNLLTLNLMHDVVTGALPPEETARRYAAATTAPPDGSPPEDMVKCRFADVATTEPSTVPPSDRNGGEPAASTPRRAD